MTAAAAALVLGGCTSGSPSSAGPEATVTSSASLEAPSNTSATSELEASEEHLEETAFAVAGQILEDMADPRSLSAGYRGNYYGNKRGRQDSGQVHSPLPEMYVVYAPVDGTDRDQRGLYINTLTAVEDLDTPEEDYLFDGIQLSFSVSDAPNKIDEKLADGEQLDIQDFQSLLTMDGITLRSAETTHGHGDVTTLTQTGEDMYLYEHQQNYQSEGVLLIDDENRPKLDKMSQDLAATEERLRQGIN